MDIYPRISWTRKISVDIRLEMLQGLNLELTTCQAVVAHKTPNQMLATLQDKTNLKSKGS